MKGFLALEDGTVFRGDSVGADGSAVGEAVFTTAMTGYQEIVTDPSYAEQLVCFTAPMVGNYGTAEGRSESARPHARAVLMREARGPAWTDWLRERRVIAVTGIDTRSLVLKLRDEGAMRAAAVVGDGSADDAVALARAALPMSGRPLARDVSVREPFVYSAAGHTRVAVVDYGCKRSILRRLAATGAAVTVFPPDATADELVRFDGVLLSNGPGDPEPLRAEIATVAELLGRVPVLGMSQNHGFAVEPSPAREATHVSLYDETIEGLVFPGDRARSVQFHPEAGPGPHDAWPILVHWIEEVSTLAKAA